MIVRLGRCRSTKSGQNPGFCDKMLVWREAKMAAATAYDQAAPIRTGQAGGSQQLQTGRG